VNLYQDLFGETQEDEELSDILTNMLACASNQDPESIKQVERLVEKTSGEVERTYEFFFNLGQVQMKQ
jgi:predicted transcriptional regulator